MGAASKKTPHSFQCRDSLWATFEEMAKELECSVDYLINDAMKQYARQRGYMGDPASTTSMALQTPPPNPKPAPPRAPAPPAPVAPGLSDAGLPPLGAPLPPVAVHAVPPQSLGGAQLPPPPPGVSRAPQAPRP